MEKWKSSNWGSIGRSLRGHIQRQGLLDRYGIYLYDQNVTFVGLYIKNYNSETLVR